ncbi:P27 family phage terminase small subunit [Saccharothrix violaceirubra]|uniref:P27 family predicted phage terminase small subunit n=1 Tax=Saccharothrix violaceirubra TaxID=413306 RepID=A0A7W7WU28_9PSEU|nr:phage terminase small subunit P27 family [Saccharothrix violaceirubra]MBB4963830.1 P27 family predicted phage terminase small subunit [Saccharothrix violaceirubra]
MPTAVAELNGYRKDRINHDEPVPAAGEVEPPAWMVAVHQLADDGEESALQVWRRLAPDLIAKKVLTPWDVEAFAVYCTSVVGYRRAAIEVAVEGMTTRGSQGVVKNPAVTAMKDCADLMNRYGAKFGLTPSDRAALAIKPDEGKGKGAERLLG